MLLNFKGLQWELKARSIRLVLEQGRYMVQKLWMWRQKKVSWGEQKRKWYGRCVMWLWNCLKERTQERPWKSWVQGPISQNLSAVTHDSFCYKLLKSLLLIGRQQTCHWFLSFVIEKKLCEMGPRRNWWKFRFRSVYSIVSLKIYKGKQTYKSWNIISIYNMRITEAEQTRKEQNKRSKHVH